MTDEPQTTEQSDKALIVTAARNISAALSYVLSNPISSNIEYLTKMAEEYQDAWLKNKVTDTNKENQK